MNSLVVTVASAGPLHMRSASVIVQTVVRSGYPISLARAGGEPVEAGSLIALVLLAPSRGEELTISCDYAGAESTMFEIATIFRGETATSESVHPLESMLGRARSA